MGDWEHFHHGSDIGVRGRGATLAEAFAQAATALTAVIAEPGTVRPKVAIALQCRGVDPEQLLVDWLNAVIYEMAVRGLLFARFAVTLAGGRLRARAWGEPVDRARHAPRVEVKGASYAQLRVYRDASGAWVAQTVVDV